MPKWPWRVVKYVLFYLDSSYHLDTVFFEKNISLLLDKTKGLLQRGCDSAASMIGFGNKCCQHKTKCLPNF